MTSRLSVHPIGTGLGMRTHLSLRCERQIWTVPPGLAGRTVKSGLRHERPNRGTVTCACRGASPVIREGGPNGSIHRN
jgi:hypothetical protein